MGGAQSIVKHDGRGTPGGGGTPQGSSFLGVGLQGERYVALTESIKAHKLVQEEMNYLSKVTHFDEDTLRRLHSRFMTIDKAIQEDGSVSLKEFANTLGLPRESLLVRRFFRLLDAAQMGSFKFRNFAMTMSKLSEKATAEDKMELSFFLFDLNNDGYIDRDELRQLVEASLETIEMELTPKQIDVVLDNTFDACDSNGNGRIEKEEYYDYCKKNPRILQPFSVDVSSLTQYDFAVRKTSRIARVDDRELHHGALHGPKDTSKFGRLRKVMGKSVGGMAMKKKKETFVEVSKVESVTDLLTFADEDEKASTRPVRSSYDDMVLGGASDGYQADIRAWKSDVEDGVGAPIGRRERSGSRLRRKKKQKTKAKKGLFKATHSSSSLLTLRTASSRKHDAV